MNKEGGKNWKKLMNSVGLKETNGMKEGGKIPGAGLGTPNPVFQNGCGSTDLRVLFDRSCYRHAYEWLSIY